MASENVRNFRMLQETSTASEWHQETSEDSECTSVQYVHRLHKPTILIAAHGTVVQSRSQDLAHGRLSFEKLTRKEGVIFKLFTWF